MKNNLKSNWMGGANHVPTKFRPASNGNVYTRTEKIRMILKERESKSIIANARAEAKAQRNARRRFFEGVNTLSDNPASKLRHSKEGVYIQPRQNGSFGPKINL